MSEQNGDRPPTNEEIANQLRSDLLALNARVATETPTVPPQVADAIADVANTITPPTPPTESK